MTEKGTAFDTYTRLYKEQWPKLMDTHDGNRLPLRSYVNGSVATTWTISYTAIRRENEGAANLLLLWAHLNHKGLWHGLLATAPQRWRDYEHGEFEIAAKQVEVWLQEIAYSEVAFIEAIGILRAYSLLEEAEDLDCYSTHPVVHQWAFHMQDDSQRTALSWLAVVLVGLAVPSEREKNFWETQTKLLPHAEQCETHVMTEDLANSGPYYGAYRKEESATMLLRAVCGLGRLYFDRDKLNKAEKIYMLVLGNEQNLSKQSSVYSLNAACSLSVIYRKQRKLNEAKELLLEALEVLKRLYGEDYSLTLWTISSLGILYSVQGTLDKAEEMIMQALNGYERTLGEDHLDTLGSLQELGWVYFRQEKYEKAENILLQVLEGRKKKLEGHGLFELSAMVNLGDVYLAQEKFGQAEEMFTQRH